MNVVLVHNAQSGSAKDIRALTSMLRSSGVSVTHSFSIKELESEHYGSLVHRGVIVMAVGGDGTLNAAARTIVGTKSTLLPMPGGTFNHFVRDLGMAPTIEDNLARLHHAHQVRIDVGYVNGELFLNNSNIGLYPFSIAERQRTKKLLGKWAAAVLSAVDQLVRFKLYELTIDGDRFRTPFVFVGNNRFDISKSLIPERSKLNDGVLTVMIAPTRSRAGFFKALLSVLRGDVSGPESMNVQTRTSLLVESNRPTIVVSYDGEVTRVETPLRYSVEPKALKVMVVPA